MCLPAEIGPGVHEKADDKGQQRRPEAGQQRIYRGGAWNDFAKNLRSAYSYVENVSYQKDLIELVNDNLRLIGLILVGIALVMTIISVVLIANTVSLVAYSKRFLLHTMELVGATPAFIRRPFVRSHVVDGIFGALIANALLGGVLYYMSRELTGFASLLDREMLLVIGAGIVLVGIVLSYLAARIAVRRYLRTDRDKLYYM